MPDVPDLRVYVPLGHAYRSVESAHVQKIAFEARRHPISGHAFVPMEFRPECDPIVWRPMLAPSAQIETSLDPQGYSGLLQRVPEARAELDRIRLELDPKLIELLAADGYRNAAELFQDADRRVQNELVGAWGNPGWREVQDAAVDAMRQTILSRFLRSSLNGGRHAWGAPGTSRHQPAGASPVGGNRNETGNSPGLFPAEDLTIPSLAWAVARQTAKRRQGVCRP